MFKAMKIRITKAIAWSLAALMLFTVLPYGASAEDSSKLKDKISVHGEVYVSPQGSDSKGKGSHNKPYRTIQKARDAIRAYMADTPASQIQSDIVVYLRGGTYFLDDALTFGPEDSGRNGYNVIYRAYPGETPIISGGEPITGWQQVSAGLYKAPAPSLDFRQLYINDSRGVRARTPNAGSYYRLKSYHNANKTINVNRAEAEGVEGGAGTAEMVIQTHWTNRHMLVDSVLIGDADATITPKEPERSQVIGNEAPKSEANQSYHWENKMAFLDEAGEWFLDKENEEVYYMPRPGEDMSTAVVIAPKLETIMKLEGTPDNPVRHIQFAGLSFQHSTWLKPNDGYAAVQATYYMVDGLWYGGKLPGAVQLEAAGHIRFERNGFRHLGATGLELIYGNFDGEIVGNVFTDIAGNGIAIGSKLYTVVNIPTDPLLTDRSILVRNNYISKVGQDYYGAVGIFGGYVRDVTVEHNEITDLPYTGISMGWGFTTATTPLQNNVIRKNRISNVMNLLDDGGGIYTLSYQPGTRIEENYIHDVVRSPWTTVNSPDKEWWKNIGIYLDQKSSGMTVANNVILNAERTIKTNIEPYGSNVFIRNHNDLEPIKNEAGIEPAYQDIRLAMPTDPPPAVPDITPPTLLSAETNEAGTEILLKFSEPMEAASDSGILDASGFALNGTTAVVTSAVMDYTDVRNARIKLTLNKTAGYGKSITLALAEGAVKDAALNGIATLNGFNVVNRTIVPYFIKFSLTGSPVLRVGDTVRLSVGLTTREGQPVDMSAATVFYSSADSGIATVDGANGTVTGIQAGTTRANVKVSIDDIEIGTSVDFTVVPATGPLPETVDIARNKPAQATSHYSDSYRAEKSNDGNVNTAWITAGTASLTIDLLEQNELYRIRRIEVVTRQDADQATTRKNFVVQASNDPTFAAYAVLGSQGDTPLTHRATWSVDVADAPGYRYIRFVKPVNFAAVAELRVLASPIAPPDEISNVSVIAGDGELAAVWDEPADPAFAGVRIYNGGPLDGGALAQFVPKGTKSAVLSGLTNGISYTFTFKTVGDDGKESFGKAVSGTPGASVNLALGRIASATDFSGSDHEASKANDDDLSSSWTSTGPASWTIDLGDEASRYAIRRIEAVMRQDLDDPITRRSFEVLASNDPSFAEYTVLGSQGDEALPHQATWSADVGDFASYRYVRFVKPTDIAAVAELRVWGSPIAAPQEVYDARAYPGGGELMVAWEEPADAKATGIRIYNGDALVQSVPLGVKKAILTGLTNGVPYSFQIKTVGRAGNESIGVVVTGTPKQLANVAAGRSATATNEYSTAHAAVKAVDNNAATSWVTVGTASLVVDLGEEYDLRQVRKIEIATRLDADQSTTRKNFEVQASNDPSFASYTVWGSQGDEALPYRAVWSSYVWDTGAYRYVRYVKPAGFAAVAELRVLAE